MTLPDAEEGGSPERDFAEVTGDLSEPVEGEGA